MFIVVVVISRSQPGKPLDGQKHGRDSALAFVLATQWKDADVVPCVRCVVFLELHSGLLEGLESLLPLLLLYDRDVQPQIFSRPTQAVL